MHSFNLNSPMDWKTFRKMPHDLQAKYIDRIMDTYHPTQGSLAEMFRTSRKALSMFMTEHHPNNHWFTRGSRQLEGAALERWLAFCVGDVLLGEEPAKDETPTEAAAETAAADETAAEETPPAPQEDTRPAATLPEATMLKGLVSFCGSAEAICSGMRRILESGVIYYATVSFRLGEEADIYGREELPL